MSAANASGSCSAHGASAATAAAGSCCEKSSKTTTAAMAGGSCEGRGVAMAAGSCAGHKNASAAMAATHDCDACEDMALCESQLKAAESHYQVVPLKNGVMYVYTADNPRNVRAVQAAVAQRTERINALAIANNAKLCPDCKQMRGAMASGKLSREVVNIDGGSISLVTSTDAKVVAHLYEMAGLTQKGIKS